MKKKIIEKRPEKSEPYYVIKPGDKVAVNDPTSPFYENTGIVISTGGNSLLSYAEVQLEHNDLKIKLRAGYFSLLEYMKAPYRLPKEIDPVEEMIKSAEIIGMSKPLANFLRGRIEKLRKDLIEDLKSVDGANI